jgi:uncharacterized protein YaaR (DUF327 family)
MAKVEGAADASFYMNPAAYAQVKDDKKTKGTPVPGVRDKKDFSSLVDDLRGKTADEIGPIRDLPVSEETLNLLMDDVRSTGDVLLSRPLPEEIMRYKQAVRNFINYVVQNAYALEHEEGIPRFLKPGYKGPRGTDESKSRKHYTKIQVIDKKLEDLAAMLLSGQRNQMKVLAGLEEIRGLLIDLMQ